MKPCQRNTAKRMNGWASLRANDGAGGSITAAQARLGLRPSASARTVKRYASDGNFSVNMLRSAAVDCVVVLKNSVSLGTLAGSFSS